MKASSWSSWIVENLAHSVERQQEHVILEVRFDPCTGEAIRRSTYACSPDFNLLQQFLTALTAWKVIITCVHFERELEIHNNNQATLDRLGLLFVIQTT